MDKKLFAQKIRIEIVELQKIQKILQGKKPSLPFLEPTIGNAIASMTDLLAYLEDKNPYYIEFNETFFNNRQATMHRVFFGDLHIGTEEGLREIIDNKKLSVTVNRHELAKSIVKNIGKRLKNTTPISKELNRILKLGGNFATFNDYLNTVLNSIKSLSNDYRLSCRVYFDALNIIRNKISHSDMTISEREKIKLKKAKFSNAIAPNGTLQMTFEGYKLLLEDIVKFFDHIYANL